MDVDLPFISNQSAERTDIGGTGSSAGELPACFERWKSQWGAPVQGIRFLLVGTDAAIVGEHGDGAGFTGPFPYSPQRILDAAAQAGSRLADGAASGFGAADVNGPDGVRIACLGMETKDIPDGVASFALNQAVCALSQIWTAELAAFERRELRSALTRLEHEAEKREKLFRVVQRLHAMIGVNDVLSEVYDSLRSSYERAEIDFFLSQDYHHNNVPVKPLRFFNSEDDICTIAFMEGRLIHKLEGAETQVAAPLSGKQGVYGVLHLRTKDVAFDAGDIQFIKLVSNTAGVAFENAKLYEQSNLLITELRMINEITKQLNQSLKLGEIFNFANAELIHIFGADYCCILQLDKMNGEMLVQASNLPSMFNEHFALDYGFSGVVYETREPLIISDYLKNPKVKSKLMEATGSRSLIASPIFAHGEFEGAILVTHRFANYFSYENFKLLQVLAVHIGLAISNASLHAEVRRMVITDNLTGLYTRRYLDEQVALMQKKDSCGSLIVVDIDNFKKVNDTYGHQVGDRILVQVSSIIRTCIRDSDIAARWGGEELAIYLPQVPIDQAVRISERMRTRVIDETNPQVTVSCGISDWNWEDDKISVESLFYKSDMALYKAKHSGKNQIRIG